MMGYDNFESTMSPRDTEDLQEEEGEYAYDAAPSMDVNKTDDAQGSRLGLHDKKDHSRTNSNYLGDDDGIIDQHPQRNDQRTQ